MALTLLERLDKFPPRLCRLFARKGPNRLRRLKTNADIARDGGLARSTVDKLGHLESWKTVTLETFAKFVKGTGVDPLASTKNHKRMLVRSDRSRKFLKNGSPAQRKMVDRILPKIQT